MIAMTIQARMKFKQLGWTANCTAELAFLVVAAAAC